MGWTFQALLLLAAPSPCSAARPFQFAALAVDDTDVDHEQHKMLEHATASAVEECPSPGTTVLVTKPDDLNSDSSDDKWAQYAATIVTPDYFSSMSEHQRSQVRNAIKGGTLTVGSVRVKVNGDVQLRTEHPKRYCYFGSFSIKKTALTIPATTTPAPTTPKPKAAPTVARERHDGGPDGLDGGGRKAPATPQYPLHWKRLVREQEQGRRPDEELVREQQSMDNDMPERLRTELDSECSTTACYHYVELNMERHNRVKQGGPRTYPDLDAEQAELDMIQQSHLSGGGRGGGGGGGGGGSRGAA